MAAADALPRGTAGAASPALSAIAGTAGTAGTAKSYTPTQLADNQYAEAVQLDQQGRSVEARASLQRALAASPQHMASRQMLVQMQLEGGRRADARALLDEGLRLNPEHVAFAWTMARMKVDDGDVDGAIRQLEAVRGASQGMAEYHAFLGAVLLRAQRHDEAVQNYLVALRTDPANPSWLVGIGAALEASGRSADAIEAYARAQSVAELSPSMAAFVSERLVRLRR